MEKETKINVLMYVCIIFFILILLLLNDNCYYRNKIDTTDTVFSTKIDTIWRDTTITEKELVPKIITKIKTL